jgi:GT2 family glycosyltransferase
LRRDLLNWKNVLVPIANVDVDLARPAAGEVLAARFLRARVLVRWAGVPVGIVEVSVRNGRVGRRDVLAALEQKHPHALAREAVRRALLQTGIASQLDPAAVWEAEATTLANPPTVTVAVCTRERVADLAMCLAALQRLEPRPLEVLVVDNAPTGDSTFRLVRERFAGFRYICESRRGLDWARNRALAEARGEIVAFVDDDVVADSGWVGALMRAFAATPLVGLVTGLIEPLEQETEAQALFERYGGFGRGCRRVYSQAPTDAPMPWTLMGAGQLGAGANMALRREIVARIGPFDPALDVGTSTLGGGDHDMFYRALRAGYLCVYEPTAVVRHRHRRSMDELRRLLFSYGHGTRCFLEREARAFPADRPGIRRLRRWWWRHWAWQRWWRAVFRPAWFPAELVWAEVKGFRRGGGAYSRARMELPGDEKAPPPAEPVAPGRARQRPPVGTVIVDVAEPLVAAVSAGAFEEVALDVRWQGREIGTVRVANRRQSISTSRLADEISNWLWHRLLEPLTTNEGRAFTRFCAAFAAQLSDGPATSGRARSQATTVIVTTCDRPGQLRRCLQSLAELRDPRPLQVVVVDNRPASGAAAKIVREFPGVELVLEPRGGSSYARNAGIAAARGEFVAMVDDDMRVAPDWLARLLQPFDRGDVMAVTGNTLPARLETRAERMLDLYGGFSRGSAPRDFGSDWFHRRRWRAVPTWQIGGSGNAAFRREIFRRDDVGCFDPTLGAGVPTGVGEDTKMFYDILHAGFTIAYEPAAVAWHYHRRTMPELRRQLFAYSKGHVAYHLATLFHRRDGRALVRIFLELPQAFYRRAVDRFRGRYAYSWSLLLLELAGTCLGPWALWRAHRLARQTERPAGDARRGRPVPPARKPPLLQAPS